MKEIKDNMVHIILIIVKIQNIGIIWGIKDYYFK